ncbi:MAG: DinG family ATP-dependent helicase [Hydrocarboniphaga sp.]|uniref:ATP-dependent DNA helicase n=1 Tax=Hydrocarboniphaga sp. TaxID=2033016 RepID=UPI00260F4F1B|nr:helicase C-terminal domain-containing protein [Hydrocarboniphaga sp.]MDB5970442.1 DinG family ATP-dependent helicase [Hydrocarboniphaga sp.]
MTTAVTTTVAVRELCEFTAKRGDLDLRFTPSPTSQEGIAGHKLVTGRRGAGYQREISLETQYKSLRTRGRADGMRVHPEIVLEEIKTHRGALERMPDNHRHLHWAQLKVYGAQLCAERKLSEARLSLIYFDVDKKSETPLTETFTAATLQAFYAEQCETYLQWDALQQAQLKQAGEPLPLRVLELVARDKACVHREKACHGASCPLAKGFYDRLAPAREDALTRYTLDQTSVRDIALRHDVCPYYLAQDLVRWVDVVIGDYNYYFDASALLHSLTVLNQWRVAVLVDEAHNLVERGRAMYSAELVEQDLPQVKGSTHRPTARALDHLASDWRRYSEQQRAEYAEHPMPPQVLIDRLTQTVAALGEYYTEHPDAGPPHLRRFYFDALHFLELAENFGPHSVCDLRVERHPHMGQTNSIVSIRNVVPARYLAPRLRDATSAVLFSATVNPPHYYMSLLGMPEDTAWLDVPSPFASSQIELHIATSISTRYRDRARSAAPIADLIAAQYAKKPGNYLAFFSSYDYLQQIADALAERHPRLSTHPQKSGMSELEQSGFLARFTDASQLVGLAVLGGAFAEGVDLPGSRLIGAFVATLGLPQFNPVNEVMRVRLGEIFGSESAYDYAYLYPGLQKVVQAAGRVIRSPEDRGTIHLIDDRYTQRRVREVLPSWWGGLHL